MFVSNKNDSLIFGFFIATNSFRESLLLTLFKSFWVSFSFIISIFMVSSFATFWTWYRIDAVEVCVILAEAAFLWENLTRSGGHDVVVVGVRTDQQWASQKQPSRSISLINWFGIPISFRFPLFFCCCRLDLRKSFLLVCVQLLLRVAKGSRKRTGTPARFFAWWLTFELINFNLNWNVQLLKELSAKKWSRLQQNCGPSRKRIISSSPGNILYDLTGVHLTKLTSRTRSAGPIDPWSQ